MGGPNLLYWSLCMAKAMRYLPGHPNFSILLASYRVAHCSDTQPDLSIYWLRMSCRFFEKELLKDILLE